MKQLKILLALLLIVFFISCIQPHNYRNYNPADRHESKNYIRILISESASNIRLYSKSGMTIKKKYTPDIIDNNTSNAYFTYMDIKTPLVIESASKIIYVNKSPYRGSLELIRAGNKISVINILPIEEYLLSVVPSEIPSSWHEEALKAQAVAARTYAYHHISTNKNSNSLYDLKSTTSSQVYKGILAEKKETTKAVNDTSGIIMLYSGKPIISFFHSSCGGHTADYRSVWNIKPLEYLKQVKCDYCSDSPDYKWETFIDISEIKSLLKRHYKLSAKIKSITFERESGRVSEVNIKHDTGIITITGNRFRLLFPPKKIRSLNFVSNKEKNSIHLTGRGWGHGVGMCQWGAKGLAASGNDFTSILRYYYKDIELKSVSSVYFARQ